jgi:hypothetical protein
VIERLYLPKAVPPLILTVLTVPLQHIARCGYYAYNRCLEALIMTRFMFLMLERHRVVAPTAARPLAASVPAL